jgi:hypothetical protein
MGSATALQKKLSMALSQHKETKEAYESLTTSLSPDRIQEWMAQENKAMARRGDALDIYDVQMQKGYDSSSTPHYFCAQICHAAPTQAEILLLLEERDEADGISHSSLAWINEGLCIEQVQ